MNLVAPSIPSRASGGGGLGTDFDCDGGLVPYVAGCLSPGAHPGGFNGQDAHNNHLVSHSKPHVAVGNAVRRLTPRECERVMGLPDDYTLIAYRGKPAKDSPRYSAIGNAIAVNVLRWIARRIELVDSTRAQPDADGGAT